MGYTIVFILGLLLGYVAGYIFTYSINCELKDLNIKYKVIIDILARWQNNTACK